MNIKNNYKVVAYCIINLTAFFKTAVQGWEQADTCGRCISQGLHKETDGMLKLDS